MRTKEQLMEELKDLREKLSKCENKLIGYCNENARLREQLIKKRVNKIKYKLGMP